MWKTTNKQAFLDCLAQVEQDAIVQNLKNFKHHAPGVTRYEHSLLVAYFSFLFCRKFHLDYQAAARGGMLHDLYHETWDGSDAGELSRWRTHPIEALHNAERYHLTEKEQDIIAKHMWPITTELPRFRESYVVTVADKVASILEKTRLRTLFGIRRNLRAFS